MTTISKPRIESIELLKGLVMTVMTIVNFGWYFDIYFKSPNLLVI